MTEEDTFKILRRAPLGVMVQAIATEFDLSTSTIYELCYQHSIGLRTAPTPNEYWAEFYATHNWTIEELIKEAGEHYKNIKND
jgi:hypothetical protein